MGREYRGDFTSSAALCCLAVQQYGRTERSTEKYVSRKPTPVHIKHTKHVCGPQTQVTKGLAVLQSHRLSFKTTTTCERFVISGIKPSSARPQLPTALPPPGEGLTCSCFTWTYP